VVGLLRDESVDLIYLVAQAAIQEIQADSYPARHSQK
jgi:hypothetical protein